MVLEAIVWKSLFQLFVNASKSVVVQQRAFTAHAVLLTALRHRVLIHQVDLL